jgi:hypothetical protein
MYFIHESKRATGVLTKLDGFFAISPNTFYFNFYLFFFSCKHGHSYKVQQLEPCGLKLWV